MKVKLYGDNAKNKCAFVNKEDLPKISKFRWRIFTMGTHNKTDYAYAYANGSMIYMHRVIMAAKNKEMIDHIDGNGLNNKRGNLRLCSYSDNQHNRRTYRKGKSSKYKGVCWAKHANKWLTQICINRKQIYLGLFVKEDDAALKYDIAAKKYFGKYALLNFK